VNSNKVAYWINSNKVAQNQLKNTQFYLVLISSTLHYIIPKYMWYHMLDLSLIIGSLLKILSLKCLILQVEISNFLWKVKEWREHNTCILSNQLYTFSHRIPSYRMSRDVKEWGAFSYAPLILYKGIRCENLYSWFARIHVVFSSFFDFSKNLQIYTLSIRHLNADIVSKLTRIKLNSNKIKTLHNNETT